MTTKMQSFRESPLLAPPGSDKTKGMTKSDVSLMEAELEKVGKGDDGVRLAEMHYYMREIGLGKPISTGDKSKMVAALEKSRDDLDEFEVLKMHYILHNLGIGENINMDDPQFFVDSLFEARRLNSGVGIALTHHFLNGMNSSEVVSEKDGATIVDAMKNALANHDLLEVAMLKYLSEELRVLTLRKVDFDERTEPKVLVGALYKARSEGDPLELAKTHYYLTQLGAYDKTVLEGLQTEKTPLPPLKKL